MQIVSINKNIQGGVPCIAGTRIPVSEVIYLYKRKKISPEEIVTKHYIQLSLYQVNKIVEWYKQNKSRYVDLDI